jgi:hypothetical protein
MNQAIATPITLGFLTVVESTELGWIAGLLLVDRNGRPLEFHCTLPVRPSKTQQILYGDTWRGFLIADRIAPALWERVKVPPRFLFGDQPELLGCVLPSPETTVVYLPRTANDSDSGLLSTEATSNRLGLAGAVPIALDAHRGFVSDRSTPVDEVMERWQEADVRVDLPEPFERIEEALREAYAASTSNSGSSGTNGNSNAHVAGQGNGLPATKAA